MAFDEIKAVRRAELDRILAENELDRREHHRVFPSAQNPVLLEIDGQKYPLRDISGGGLSFFAQVPFYPGWIHPGRIILSAREKPLAVNILIIEYGFPEYGQGTFRGAGFSFFGRHRLICPAKTKRTA
jgi:hypothetical protein